MGWRAWLGFSGGKSRAAVSMTSDRPGGRFDALGWGDFPWWQAADGTANGLRVSRQEALAVPSVFRGRNLICSTVAGLPVCVVDGDNNAIDNPLLRQIDPNVPNIVTIAQTVEDLLFEGISWWQVLARGFDDYPTSAQHVDFHNVTWQMPSEFPLNRLPSGYYPGSHIFVLSSMEAVPVRDMIRFDSPNPAILVHGARAIRRALKLEMAADRFADNPAMRDYFTVKDGETDPDDSAVTEMLDAWIAARATRTTGYVPGWAQRMDASSMSPADLQLANLIEKATVGLANLMGLDPEDFGVSTTSRTYQNAVDRRQDRINECYSAYALAVSSRLSMGDITKRGQTVRFDWDDFLRANPLDRATIQKTYVDMGTLTDDEVRADEGRPPLTASQRKALTPAPLAPPRPEHSNVVTAVAAPGAPGLASVTPIGARAAATHSQGLAPAATFARDDNGPGLVFDVSDVAHSFSVNESKRTITGLVVPWDRIGRSNRRRWKFAPNSLQFDASKVNRIKLLSDHDNSQIIGRVEKTWADEVGQWATFKVARGPAGDRALAEANDGVKDGLSVGVGFEGDDHGMTFGADPAGDGDVVYVTSAPWRETSQVAMPAFDDARVSAVSMAADPPNHLKEGTKMPETDTAPAATVAAPVAALDMKPITDAIAAGFAAMKPATAPETAPVDVEKTIETQVAAAFSKFKEENEGPAFVNPARTGDIPTAKVNEKPLYRFDGGTAQRCFTADLAQGVFKDDPKIREQAEQFVADQMAAAFANISTTNVTTLNPTIPRPDLWVPNLYFARPIGSMVQGGIVDSVTKQTLPKFSSSTGMAQDHTQGTEPADGAFTTTSQDITPKAISGRVDINREVIDQGGTPQADQIIWDEMVAFYMTLLETRLVAMFVALGLSDTPIVGTDTELQAALQSEFAGLQFIKGGDRYRGLALNQDLYTATMTAVDADGRLLFPPINPQNAGGTSMSDMSSIRIGSKVGVPAWALAAANSGPGKSFLFVPESCYQWFSAPRRFDLNQVNVSSVGIGIWGYSAEFCKRNSDVIQLAYTAS